MVILSACGPKKKAIEVESSVDNTTSTIWNDVKASNIDFESYYAKANVQVSFDDFSMGGKADIRIRKDSAILLSFRKFGFEVARALIHPDSVFVISRLEGIYSAISIDSLKHEYNIPFGFSQIQDVFVGNHVVQGQEPVTSFKTNDGYVFKSMNEDLVIDYSLDNEFRVGGAKYMDMDGRSFEMTLEKFRDFGLEKEQASERSYFYPDRTNSEYSLELELDKIELNTFKKMKFEIPSSYKRL